MRYMLIMIGAGMGGALRALVAAGVSERINSRFPWGTFLVNISGCFGIGVIATLLTERFPANPYWRVFLVVGFLGGYTTFSSFEYETFAAARSGAMWVGLLNLLASVIVGYLAVWLGWFAAVRR